MNTKQKLGYMAVGGVLVALGMTVAVLVVSPVTAQWNKFGYIECAGLTVVGADGDAQVRLTTDSDGGSVAVFGAAYGGTGGRSKAGIGITSRGGQVYAIGKDDKSLVMLFMDEHGGKVELDGKDFEWQRARVALGFDEHGGRVQVQSKRKGEAVMGINEDGNGAVSTYDKNGHRR